MLVPRWIVPFVLGILFLAGGGSVWAEAEAGVVGNGDPATCTDDALNTALTGGGNISFNCGAAPIIIDIGGEKLIGAETQIDGGGLITLKANGSRHFVVSTGIKLTLRNLTLRDGFANFDGGSIYNLGTLILDHVNMLNNSTSLDYSGGAVVNYGSLTITESTLEGNSGGSGGAVYPRWEGSRTSISNSVLRDNHALSPANGWGGAMLLWDGAVVEIENTQFISNTANAGGAIYNTTRSELALNGVTLRGNSANNEGGAIYNYEKLAIENSTIAENTSALGGGGLYNAAGTATIVASRFTGNRATADVGVGGNIANRSLFVSVDDIRYGSITLTDSTVAEGYAQFVGGGIFTEAGLEITRSAILSNTTDGSGGGLYVVTGDHDAVEIVNSTLSANQAANHGGGIYKETGTLSIGFSTIADNTATEEGSNLYMDGGQAQATTLYATILADGDCVVNGVTSQGDNLDTGGSCGLDAAVDQLNMVALLEPLALNGGPTLTRMLKEGSPARDAVTENECPAEDQRGQPRPAGIACDTGAVEAEVELRVCGGVFPAILDAFVAEGAPGASNGGGNQVEVGAAGGVVRGLLAFEPGELLPANVVVESARLDLPLAAPAPDGATFEVSAVGAAWDESVTWDTQPAAGANFGVFNAGGTDDVFSVDVTTLVIQWANQVIGERSIFLTPAEGSPKLAFKSRESGEGATLTIVCGPAPATLPADTQAATQKQIQEAGSLRAASSEPVLLDIRKGVVHFADFEVTPPPSVFAAANGDEELAQAEWFIEEYRPFLRLGAGDELQLVSRATDGLTLYFRQVHKGIPVWPSSIVIRLDNAGHVTGVTGGYTLDISLEPTPILTAAQAEEIALSQAAQALRVTGDIQLRYVNLAVLGEQDTQTHLAWAVPLGSGATDLIVYVDAATGAQRFVEYWNRVVFDLNLRTANNTNRPATRCWGNSSVTNDIAWFTEAGPVANPNPAIDADGNNAFNNIRTAYNYYMNTPNVNRDSYNGAGAIIDLIMDVQSLAQNAQFTPGCNEMEFGDQMATVDITAHEYTHGVNNATNTLVYANLSGALDESLADIFGYLANRASPNARAFGAGTPGTNAPVAGRAGCLNVNASRDMADPPCYNYGVTGAPYPDRMSAQLTLAAGTTSNCATNDCGFVHGNSSIHNKAAWLMINGGEFGGRSVKPIGTPNDAARLFYGMMTGCLGNTTDFLGASWCAISESQEFMTAYRQCQVKNAYAAVGINPIVGDADCDGIGDLAEKDDDGDLTPDATDNCPNLVNDQANLDGDALGDACDEDKDGDGLNDPLDNCPWAANNAFPDLQNDWNGDGVGDACDDSDGDKTPDGRDNCRDIPNEKQENADGDRFGDACDNNDDNDAFDDGADNCPTVPNNGQENDDGDLFGDACDLCRGLKSNDNGDVDGDGVGNPCDPDADADGICSSGGPRSGERGLESSPGRACVPGKGPGPSDNCPLVPNDTQLDIDNNGLGFACDGAERGVFYGQLKDFNERYSISQGVVTRIPIPICPQCGTKYVPQNIFNEVTVALPATVDARIVDGTGRVVAKSVIANNVNSFSFNPAPFAASSFRVASAAGEMSLAEAQTDQPLPADMYYYLELQLALQAQPIANLEVKVEAELEEVTPPVRPDVFLPVLRR